MSTELTAAEVDAITLTIDTEEPTLNVAPLLREVTRIVAAREAAARREALLEGDARRRELSRNLERATELCQKAQAEALAQVERVARVEALIPRNAFGHVTGAWVVRVDDLRAALAEPERDEESS